MGCATHCAKRRAVPHQNAWVVVAASEEAISGSAAAKLMVLTVEMKTQMLRFRTFMWYEVGLFAGPFPRDVDRAFPSPWSLCSMESAIIDSSSIMPFVGQATPETGHGFSPQKTQKRPPRPELNKHLKNRWKHHSDSNSAIGGLQLTAPHYYWLMALSALTKT